MKNKSLFIGPSPSLITGQSLAFSYISLAVDRSEVIYNSSGSTSLSKLFSMFLYFCNLPIKMIVYRPKVIYITISRTNVGFVRDFYAFLFAKLIKARVVVHLHGSDFQSFVLNSGKLTPLINWAYQIVDTAIVLTDGMKEQFVDYPHINVEVVQNCYYMSEGRHFEDNKVKGNIKILYLSNLMQTKGVLELLDAVLRANELGIGVELKIAGAFLSDGELTSEEMKKRIFSILDDKVSYCGVIQGQRKEFLLGWANVVALPSYYPTEAQPLVLIEGMAAGRYILTSTAGYISEFVTHKKNGYVVPSVSTDTVFEGIQYIASNIDEVEAASKTNKLYAQANFSREQYVNKIFEIIGVNA